MMKKRINLYNKFRDNAPDITKFDAKYPDFTTWDATFFNNEDSVKSIWNKSLKFVDKTTNKKLWGSDLSDFYTTFVCSDKSWAKNGVYCKSSVTPVNPPSPIGGGGNGSTGGGGNVSQGWLADPTGNQTWEYQLRDCKWVARKIGKTDEYLISDKPKYQSSVNILNGKYSDLVKNCNKPSQTQPNNQNVVTGGGQQPGQTGITPSTGGQSGVNQTQGLGVPNVSELGLDEIYKLVNPVKPETVTQTSTPTTQQESIEVNTNILKEEFYSTLKKMS